ncbi:MAG: hypothetical protein U0R52_04320 [Solirubrobacterales bacterium]
MIAVARSARFDPAAFRRTWTCSPVRRARRGSASFSLTTLVLTRVVVDQLVADGNVEDLTEPGQRLVGPALVVFGDDSAGQQLVDLALYLRRRR